MNVTITPKALSGKISAIASKSVAHRLLICAAFSAQKTKIRCENTNNDILATVNCLNALGASIDYKDKYFFVKPIKSIKSNPVLNCGESGSTLRFLLPVAAAVSDNATFLMSGRLTERPLSPLIEELEAHGIVFEYPRKDVLHIGGRLKSGNYTISGEVSSQFISGLLFALCLLDGNSTLTVTGNIESAPYIKMTLDALIASGAKIKNNKNVFYITGDKLSSPNEANVEGDWSNAAFPLCAAALGGTVTIDKISLSSHQGDIAILSILERFGAKVKVQEDSITVSHSKLSAIELDASQIPDLVPVIATVAAGAEGITKIYGASRLRIKESDRIMSTKNMLTSLGGYVEEADDGLIIHGKSTLSGGVVNSFNDHRIAMSAAVASVICDDAVTINGADAVNKSYPDFWSDIITLGASISIEK